MDKDKKNKKGAHKQAKREEKPASKVKNQKKKVEESDDDSSANEEVQTVFPTQKKKPLSVFAMLADEDEDDDNDNQKSSESEDSEPETVAPKKPLVQAPSQKNAKKQQQTKGGKKNQKDEEDFDAVLKEFSEKPAKQTTAADKKQKKNKKGAKDVDEIFESIELDEDKRNGTTEEGEEATTRQKEEKAVPEIRADMTADELAQIYEQMMDAEEDADDDGKKKKKKGNKQQQQQQQQKKKAEKEAPRSGDEGSDDDDNDEEEEEEGSTVKTAAQKKKEKKERQKAEKLMKAQQAKTKPSADKGGKKEPVTAKTEAPAKPEAEAEEDVQPSKKDKKKKKGDAKEEEKTKKSNKMVSKILETQRILKEEEERRKKEEEERIRKEEEEQRLREEKERLEKEKKERKKQKEKERIKRQKAEGKFLTEKQKEDRKRAQQMLESHKALGVEIPVLTESEKQKRVVYTKKQKTKVQQQTSSGTPSVTTPTETEQKPLVPEPAKEEKVEQEAEEEDDVKDNWDDSSSESEDESQASETPEDVTAKNTTNQATTANDSSKDDDDDADDDDDEDDEDDDEDESSSEEEEDDGKSPQERAREKALAAIEKRKDAAEAAKSADKLRAPVICVLGHVDTGKTKILDKLRRSHVQDGEAGGITQQIGATNVPHHSLKEQIKMCKEIDLKIPGLLIIDTPGHESFSNLRTRGSSLCDIAILVVDIMHGLEPQTIESINILKQKKTPFVVALNKVDRLFGWVTNCHADIVNQLKKQKPNTKMEFEERAKHVIVQFAEQGLNARLFYENTKPREFISLVPTSAVTGDGVGNLIALICELTQSMMLKRIMYTDELQATVMEVKAIAGHGTTIDVILVNGKLSVGSTIVVAGQEGPIVTQVRSLLLPPPMQEIRVKSNFESHKEVLAAQGCKIAGKDLEKAIAGLPLYVAHSPEEVEIYKEELSQMLKDVLSDIKVSEKGVYVQASTLGSLEALLSFLKSSKIPFSGINIGPVHKRDIMKTMAMLEHDPLFACILAFDVKVEKDAQEMAESNNIQIFQADIIYHLFDNFIAYRKKYYQQKQEEFKHVAMFPCKLRIMPEHVFNSRDPIICGVVVEAGFVKEGTILCVPSKNFIDVGRVASVEVNHKAVEKATKGMEVCIKIEPIPGDAPKMVGRHFEVTDELVSKISRNSIDAVKNWFRDDMERADWNLIVELKKIFGII